MLRQLIWRGVLVLLLVVMIVPPVHAQEQDDDPVRDVIERLPPRRRVGQLVVVSFPGTELGEEAAITGLIQEYGVGGVLLRPSNDNFGASSIDAGDMLSMTNHLQEAAWYSSRTLIGTPTDVLPYQTSFLPLFIGIEPQVDGLPVTSFISDTSTLPSPLALGATWNRALSEAAGQVLGRELAVLGINLYLGPNLDVLQTPRPGDVADPGTRVFGGSPYWVGELGRAHIRGLHQGSEGQLLVVPRHFPGLGGADRPLEEEIPTVQKSLEQLLEGDLVPFFEVTRGVPGEASVADGLLITHARYRGFQGNVRAATRPISLDVQALEQALEGLGPWREGGGILVADDLGVPSLRRFEDPSERSFNARRLAQDALLAGNDLIVLDRFGLSDAWDEHFTNVRDTLEFLTQRYENDPTFQARVDEALYRVVSAKRNLYPQATLSTAQRDVGALEERLGQGQQNVNAQVAVNGITRHFPFSDDLLPAPPQPGERIVIFAPEVPGSVPSSALAESLLRFYGPGGTEQVRIASVQPFSFRELLAALDDPPTEVDDPGYQAYVALERADWIVFATTGLDVSSPESVALKRFLEHQADLLGGRIVVLNFGPPYELDSTEVSKLDLYYTLYSTGDAFVETAVRALFRDVRAVGDSPVSVPALNYYLPYQLEPDPAQVIELTVVDEEGQELMSEETKQIRKDDELNLRTSVILDRNGHPVPDDTPVLFTLSYPQEDRVETIASQTENGVAFASVTLDRVGQLNITVQSDPAPPLFNLQLTVREEQPVIIISTTPTPQPTEPAPTLTPEPDAEKVQTLPGPLRLPVARRSHLLGWGLVGCVGIALVGFVWAQERDFALVATLRLILWGIVGALLGYLSLIAVVRWLQPHWVHRIAGQEYLMGLGSTMAGGVALVTVNFLIGLRNSSPARGDAQARV
jgi:beta-N-acetylhexosaminidase